MVKAFENFEINTLYGIYNDDDYIVSVHKTEEGANENLESWNKKEEGHYVDIVVVLP